jgi:ribosomal protein L11 methyltransferase
MILWQKTAGPKWLATNEPLLEAIAGNTLALISEPSRKRSVVQIVCRRRSQAEKLRRDFGGTITLLPRNWSPIAPPHGPIRIGRRLEIVSEPAPSRAGAAQLVVPAAGAFGTGEHATTAMSLRLLEELTRNWPRGWKLLDAGTGSGILALAARRFGASDVLGLDNDPRAIATARQNARLNRIARAGFTIADVLEWKTSTRYDVVTANLFSELLIAALSKFRRILKPHGHLIISGILRDQAETVARALRKSGFRLEKKRRRGKWMAAVWAR